MLKTIWFVTFVGLLLTSCQPNNFGEIGLRQTAVPTETPPIGVAFFTRAAPTASFIQTTPTPLPAPTVTPTATPIVYRIQSGDTILGIAIQRGTVVDEILALNPEIIPENLQIGQAIFLPPPPTVTGQLAQGTPAPLLVSVSKIRAYQSPVGSLWLLGEVTNEGEVPVENVQVEIGLQAADGQNLGTMAAWVATAIIMPGEQGPFGVLVHEAPANFAHQSVSVVGGQTVVALGTRKLDIDARDVVLTANGSSVSLSGKVVNSGETAAGLVWLIATFYDAQGNVTGFHQLEIAAEMAAGAERPFTLESAPPGGETVAYSLQIEAQVAND